MVVEAKLGATVADQQLRPYREEARRRASGGPVALVLLTARADSAELRHRAWRPVRWFALLRRWEVTLAAAGDTDPEFARLRAQPVAIRAQDREGLPMIAVPDSVAYYWRDPVNEAALNVLGDAGEVPGDLSLPEAEQFALAARRVRVKFWQLLNGLRAAVWDGAVRAAFPGARLLSYGEHQAVANKVEQLADPSLDHAWTERAVAGVYRLRDGAHLFTGVRLAERDQALSLEFYHWSTDETTALTDELDLGADWSDDGEGRRITVGGLFATLRGPEQVDPSPAQAVAQAAVSAVASLL